MSFPDRCGIISILYSICLSIHHIIGRLIYKMGTKYAYVNALQNCSILNIRIVFSLMCSLCLTQYIGLDYKTVYVLKR